MAWGELQVDAESAVPIYRQLYNQIGSWIHTGRLTDGAKLLPTRELAGLLGLNRTTVAAAYDVLEKEGLIKAHVGRGSYVCAAKQQASAPDWEERFRIAAPDRELQQAVWSSDEEMVSFSSSRPDPGA